MTASTTLTGGVVVYFRVMEGTLTLDQTVRMMASGAEYGLVEIGHLLPTKLEPCKSLSAGGGGVSHRLH